MILAEALPQVTDPLALIVGAGGAVISALAMIVWGLMLARAKRIEDDLKELAKNLVGRDGMTVQITEIQGRLNTAEAKIKALESTALDRERFESATKDQNSRLDELREQTRELDRKVEKVDRTLLTSGLTHRSYTPPESPTPPRPPPRPAR